MKQCQRDNCTMCLRYAVLPPFFACFPVFLFFNITLRYASVREHHGLEQSGWRLCYIRSPRYGVPRYNNPCSHRPTVFLAFPSRSPRRCAKKCAYGKPTAPPVGQLLLFLQASQTIHRCDTIHQNPGGQPPRILFLDKKVPKCSCLFTFFLMFIDNTAAYWFLIFGMLCKKAQ